MRPLLMLRSGALKTEVLAVLEEKIVPPRLLFGNLSQVVWRLRRLAKGSVGSFDDLVLGVAGEVEDSSWRLDVQLPTRPAVARALQPPSTREFLHCCHLDFRLAFSIAVNVDDLLLPDVDAVVVVEDAAPAVDVVAAAKLTEVDCIAEECLRHWLWTVVKLLF